MAWRIDEWVVRGEIDNRSKGQVCGRIWLCETPEPIRLELLGNACSDLAGCLLTFTRKTGHALARPDGRLAPVQKGYAGDITASRKVRVLDIPLEEALSRGGGRHPSHWANAIYLEWFSEANGRVLVESVDFDLAVSAPSWKATPADEQARRSASEAGFRAFMAQLDRSLEAHRFEIPKDRELDEFEWEKLLRDCDARTDKFGALLDRHRDDPDRDEIVAREMGWSPHEEDGEDVGFEIDDDIEPDEEVAPDPATEGVDWVRGADGSIDHPLVRRVMDGAIAFRQRTRESRGNRDADLQALVDAYTALGPKLGGALGSLVDRIGFDPAMVVALLKRAMKYVHEAQGALARLEGRDRVLPPAEQEALRNELFEIREAMLRIMHRMRTDAE